MSKKATKPIEIRRDVDVTNSRIQGRNGTVPIKSVSFWTFSGDQLVCVDGISRAGKPVNGGLVFTATAMDEIAAEWLRLRTNRQDDTKADAARKFLDDRTAAADRTFEEAHLEVTVADSDGWQTDGPDRLIRRFYYVNPQEPDGDSVAASFIVDFQPNTAIVTDSHANL